MHDEPDGPEGREGREGREERAKQAERDGRGAQDAGSREGAGTLEVLVDQHRRFLMFLERRVGSRAEAEDLLQAAFARTVEAGTDGLDDESVVAWFYRVLRNALIDHHRRRSAVARGQKRLESEWSDRLEEPELRDVACACVAALLSTLKPEYAAALRSVDLEDRPLEDLATREAITPGNARVRLHRARRALKSRVEETCRTCAEHGCRDCTCGAPASP